MPEQSTRDRVCKAVGVILAVHPNDVKDTDDLVDDYGADSLDGVEILIELEDEFRIQIRDEDFERCNTIKDLIDLMERLT